MSSASGTERNLLVDSLRALAALSVVGYHLTVTRPFESPLRPYMIHLFWGVTVFFLISGYVLFRPFIEARLRGMKLGLGAYGVRRVLRIVPAYWVALTLVALFGNGGETVRADPLAYYGFAQVYSADTVLGGIGQAWTLDVEVCFYALLPALALLLTAPRWGTPARVAVEVATYAAMMAVAIVYTAGLEVPALGPGLEPDLFWLPRFLGQFALGMALATLAVWAARTDRLPQPLEFLSRYPTATWCLVPVGYYLASKVQMSLAARDLVDGLTAAALIWPAVMSRSGRGVAATILAWRPLVFVGVVSYGVYLYHFAIITRMDSLFDGVDGAVGTLLWVAFSLAGAVLAGALSFWFVERPSIRLGRRLARSTPARPSWGQAAP